MSKSLRFIYQPELFNTAAVMAESYRAILKGHGQEFTKDNEYDFRRGFELGYRQALDERRIAYDKV